MTSWAKFVVIGVLVAGVAIPAAQRLSSRRASTPVAVVAPAELSAPARAGKTAFDADCAQCHGVNGAGTDKGPPFVHPVYNPGHHSDEAFFLAPKIGVRSHHWNFGDMPSQPQVSPQQLKDIIAYIRAVQEANGIFYQQRRM
jgi:mono/diheme cytochrome c family protein